MALSDWDTYLENVNGVTFRGAEAFLPLDAALEAVTWLEARDTMILGIEGFWLAPDVTKPSLGHIATLWSDAIDWDENVRGSISVARRLLAAWRGEIDAVVFTIADSPGDVGAR
jgi:hypothetical protein